MNINLTILNLIHTAYTLDKHTGIEVAWLIVISNTIRVKFGSNDKRIKDVRLVEKYHAAKIWKLLT